MVDPAEHLDVARTADACGWDCIQVADAPFFPEEISVPYPYTPDGTRFWPLDMPVLDPWVAITAMAVVTERIRFMPSVLRLAIRQPLLEAAPGAGDSGEPLGEIGTRRGQALDLRLEARAHLGDLRRRDAVRPETDDVVRPRRGDARLGHPVQVVGVDPVIAKADERVDRDLLQL